MTTQARRPKLEVCLENLLECAAKLRDTSGNYQRLRAALELATTDPQQVATSELGLNLTIGGNTSVPVPLPAGHQERIALMEEAMSFLGEEVINLWNMVAEIGMDAKTHCAQAAARAAEAQIPQPPQVPLPPQPPAVGQNPPN